MEHVGARRGKNVSPHYFQTKVIAPLRDAGVLVASSSRGYKLPASKQDLYDFVSHSNTNTGAKRMERAFRLTSRLLFATSIVSLR